MMELFIETLTGTAFELRVSPFETIMSVKAKIQRLEGIPISQQHLIWQSMELEDDYCLHDYSIHDGATLKLVLAMRGGPINTRRIAMEDPALREMAEYMEANREEILDKLPGNRQVTLLVYREGDQLNFFRVVDRGDGTLTPLSESLSPLHFSGASMYNLYDDDDDDEPTTRETVEENVKTKEKMQLLRSKMENLTLTKKPKKKMVVRPPSSGRPGSRTRSSAHRLGTSAGHAPRHLATLTKTPLPPLGQHHVRSASGTANPEPPSGRSSVNSAMSLVNNNNNGAETPVMTPADTPAVTSTTPSSARGNRCISRDVLESAKPRRPLSSVKEDYSGATARSIKGKGGAVAPPVSEIGDTGGAAAAAAAAAATGKKEESLLLSSSLQLSSSSSGSKDEKAKSSTSGAAAGDVVVDSDSKSSKDQNNTTTTTVAPSSLTTDSQKSQLKNNLHLPLTSTSAATAAAGVTHQKAGELVELSSSTGASNAGALQSEWTPTWSAAAQQYSARKKDLLTHSLSMGGPRPPSTATAANKGLERIMDHHGYESSFAGGSHHRPTTSATSASSSKRGSKEQLTTLEGLVQQRPPTSKYGNLERKQGLMLESLSQSEARGLLRQASIERLGSSKLANFVRSASKSRASYNLGSASLHREGSRVGTPEARLVSGRLGQRVSAGRDRDRLSPTPRLPPVKQKKKATKRCFVCAKKTGLATSYQCRCGNNFCATHRYAESHDCTFDYKTEGRKLLEQANPVVSAPKLPKI